MKFKCPECEWENFTFVDLFKLQCTKCKTILRKPEKLLHVDLNQYPNFVGRTKEIIVEEEIR